MSTIADLLGESLIWNTSRRLIGSGRSADALNVIEALFELRSRRRMNVARLRVVMEPGASWNGDDFIVSIAPDFGYAGRPSSAYIANALMEEAS